MIQEAQPEDISIIVAIEKRANVTPWNDQILFDALEGNDEFLLCRNIDDHVCGYLIAQQVLDEASLQHIVIDPEFQSEGLGRQLLCHWLHSLNPEVKTVWLEVRESNEIAKSLYQSLDFERVGKRTNYYRLPNSSQKETAEIYCLKREFLKGD